MQEQTMSGKNIKPHLVPLAEDLVELYDSVDGGQRINPHPMIDCPYYQGKGTCGRGDLCHVYGEPRCITEEPVHGWRRRTPDGRFAPKETRMG